jgi:hypothetical protein
MTCPSAKPKPTDLTHSQGQQEAPRISQASHNPSHRRIIPRFARDDMMIAMSAHNECVEYQRLQHAYDDAIIVWEQDRLPSIRPINTQKLSKEEAAELRDQALLKRNIAANDLYTHLKTCPTCKHSKK